MVCIPFASESLGGGPIRSSSGRRAAGSPRQHGIMLHFALAPNPVLAVTAVVGPELMAVDIKSDGHVFAVDIAATTPMPAFHFRPARFDDFDRLGKVDVNLLRWNLGPSGEAVVDNVCGGLELHVLPLHCHVAASPSVAGTAVAASMPYTGHLSEMGLRTLGPGTSEKHDQNSYGIL